MTDGIIFDSGGPWGNCPVQADGTIDGHRFYFRSRGSRWSLDVGGQDPCADATWSYSEHYGPWPDAGWITDEEALAFIEKGAKLFRETTTTKGEKPP